MTISLNGKTSHQNARRFAAGSISVEYLLVASLVCTVLFAGQPSPVDRLLNAMATQFEQFSILVAMP